MSNLNPPFFSNANCQGPFPGTSRATRLPALFARQQTRPPNAWCARSLAEPEIKAPARTAGELGGCEAIDRSASASDRRRTSSLTWVVKVARRLGHKGALGMRRAPNGSGLYKRPTGARSRGEGAGKGRAPAGGKESSRANPQRSSLRCRSAASPAPKAPLGGGL